jgi:hypothetical protein
MTMSVRRVHRIIGILLFIPFFGWALTGLVFSIKPGYAAAYEVLSPKTYPVTTQHSIIADPGWLELRYLRTILGDHLLVRTSSGWVQLDPASKQQRNLPSEADFRALLKDAFSSNPQRYGEIATVSGNTATTTTGVEVSLDWNKMSLQQKGRDTDRIDLLYRIHYLQWTGVKSIDRVMGFVGIVFVLLLTSLGGWLAFR